MNKDDILAMSRAENQGNDEYEKQVLEKAGKLAAQAGMLACCLVAAASVAVTGRVNAGCWVIYFSIYASLFWTKWRYLKKRHERTPASSPSTTSAALCSPFWPPSWPTPWGAAA